MILIENQPTFKNPKMKGLSDTLYTWFMIRGLVDREINGSTIEKIRFISPSNKLKNFDQSVITDADDDKKYKATKNLSVENNQTILSSYELKQWVSHILSYKKNDDLADSFLQGWYVLNNIYENKLYDEWTNLYKLILLVVADEVEAKKTNPISIFKTVMKRQTAIILI